MKKSLLAALAASLALTGCSAPAAPAVPGAETPAALPSADVTGEPDLDLSDLFGDTLPATVEGMTDAIWGPVEKAGVTRVSQISIQASTEDLGDMPGPSGSADIKAHPEEASQKVITIAPIFGLEVPGFEMPPFEFDDIVGAARPTVPAREAVDAAVADWFASREAAGDCPDPRLEWLVGHDGTPMSSLGCGLYGTIVHQRWAGQSVELPENRSGAMLTWLLDRADEAGAPAISSLHLTEDTAVITMAHPSQTLANGETCSWDLRVRSWDTTCDQVGAKPIQMSAINRAALAKALDDADAETAMLSWDLFGIYESLSLTLPDGSRRDYLPGGDPFDPSEKVAEAVRR